QLCEAVREAIYTRDPDGMITSLNPAFERYTGWACSEWVGKSFAPLIHPDDLPRALETFAAVLAGRAAKHFFLRVRTKDGRYRVGEFSKNPQLHGTKVVGVL